MMTIATQKPPEYAALLDEVEFLRRENRALSEDKNYLEELVRHLKRLRFSSSSEVAPSGQKTLFNEAEVLVDEGGSDNKKRPQNRCKKKHGRPVRKTLPSNLPKVHKTIDIAESERVCPCSGHPLKCIGREVSKQPDIEPMKAVVVVTSRLKYVCDCDACKDSLESPNSKN